MKDFNDSDWKLNISIQFSQSFSLEYFTGSLYILFIYPSAEIHFDALRVQL